MKHETHCYLEPHTRKLAISLLVIFLFLAGPSLVAAEDNVIDESEICIPSTCQQPQIKAACTGYCAKQSNFGLKPVGEAAKKGEKGKAATPLFQERSVPQIIGQILGGLLSLTGTIFFILMLYGGGLWMSARGEENQVEKAKNVILHSIIGLVVTSFSYVIIQFVFSRFVPAA